MDSPDYSDSEDSCSGSSCSGNSSIDGPSAPPSVDYRDVGKRVIFTSGNDKKYGMLRFCGETLFAEGVWCGVELDHPVGKNNGSIQGIRYFTCDSNYGVFVPCQRVELDMSRRSRSRPNSKPSSRATSVERKDVSSKPTKTVPSAGSNVLSLSSSVNKLGLSMQQELVNRLSQPRRSSHPVNSSTSNRRQPMKAFATKGIEAKKEEKKTLAPFRTGGMYKAASTENIRGMKDKDKTKPGSGGQKLSSGMPGRQKSSSERDLRNAGKSTSSNSSGGGNVKKVSVKPIAAEPASKTKWKQMRPNSCSDLLAPPAPSNPTPPDPSTASSKSSTTSSSSHTSLENYHWPRTSTPGNRDDLTPDGCSSPEDSVNDSSSQAVINKGFVAPPDKPAISKLRPSETTEHDGEGLANHVKRFTEAQGDPSSPPMGFTSVQPPEQQPHPQKLYKNRPSGTATLDHPLITSTINDGEKALKKLLGPKNSLEGVTAEDVIRLFREQSQRWQNVVADLEGKLERKQEEVKALNGQLTQARKSHEAKVVELVSKHQGEISALMAAHRHPMAERKGCPPSL